MGSRRDFIKKAILLSGAAGSLGVIPESIQRAFAIEPDPDTTYLDAEHVVILMQENRSFDHAFGTLQGVRGFNDPRALELANGNSVFLQTNATGDTYAPWRLDIKDTRATWMGSLPHSRESQIDAWNDGHHNNWLNAKRSFTKEYADIPLTMGHYTREDLPFYYALADAFTVCDQNYCGAMTSTKPNRAIFWTGTTRNQQITTSRVFMRNPEIEDGDLSWITYPERLQEAGVPWKFYQHELFSSGGMTPEERAWLSTPGFNVLEFFRNYNIHLTPRYDERIKEEMGALVDQIHRLQAEIKSPQVDPERIKEIQRQLQVNSDRLEKLRVNAKRVEGGPSQFPVGAEDLNRRAFVTNDSDTDFQTLETINFQEGSSTLQMDVPKGDLFHQFREDVNAGRLPAISWLAAPMNFSDHPQSPWYGAWYVSEVMDILTNNPEVWKKTIFILTYDENDGYFDHAPSFVASDPQRRETGGASDGIDSGLEYTYAQDELARGLPEDQARTGPIGLGYRVPMIVASPWSRGGWVNSQLFEHTSTIRFLEHFVRHKFNKQVVETNISPWRRAIAGDLTSVFRPYDGKKPELPFLDRNKFVESIQRARHKEVPSGYKALSAEEIVRFNRDPRASKQVSEQESGVRQACAIPYELYTDGHLSADRKSFELFMHAGDEVFGLHAAGSPFNVYCYGTKGTKTGNGPVKKNSQLNMMAATYVVRAGELLSDVYPLSLFTENGYALAVHGPNGFYRRFDGNDNDPELEIDCCYEAGKSHKHGLSGNIELRLRCLNKHRSYIVDIVDNSYETKAITVHSTTIDSTDSIILTLARQHSWYDFSLTVRGFEKFVKRYAGHVDTGMSSYTDPLMGGVITKHRSI